MYRKWGFPRNTGQGPVIYRNRLACGRTCESCGISFTASGCYGISKLKLNHAQLTRVTKYLLRQFPSFNEVTLFFCLGRTEMLEEYEEEFRIDFRPQIPRSDRCIRELPSSDTPPSQMMKMMCSWRCGCNTILQYSGIYGFHWSEGLYISPIYILCTDL